jgi:hypothetical protein
MLMTSVRAWRSTAAKSFGANASAWIVYQASLGALARAALVGNPRSGSPRNYPGTMSMAARGERPAVKW